MIICIFNLFKIKNENRRDCCRGWYIGKRFLEKTRFEANYKKWTLDALRGELPGSQTGEFLFGNSLGFSEVG